MLGSERLSKFAKDNNGLNALKNRPESRVAKLENWCTGQNDDDIASACMERGILSYHESEELRGELPKDNERKLDPQVLHKLQEALKHYERGCNLRRPYPGQCRYGTCLHRECDQGAAYSCFNAGRILDQNKELIILTAKDYVKFYIDAAK